MNFKALVNKCPITKVLSPDDFIGEFYKKFKDIITPDLLQILNDTFDRDLTLENLNTSYIVLIPKEEAKKPQDFRPINLIHSIQKILAKRL